VDALFRGKLMAISGHLGAFSVRFQGRHGLVGHIAGNSLECFDMILDLCSPPHLTAEVTPLGYYAPDNRSRSLEQALGELPALLGRTEKPRYYHYDSSICAHIRKGVVGCVRCIEHCPAKAICSTESKLQIDPYLCQGCGVCASVCPSGAVRYNNPAPAVTLGRIRTVLATFSRRAGAGAVIMLHEDEPIVELAPWVLPIQAGPLAAQGLEIWLATLAYGAAQVLLLPAANTSTSARGAIDLQHEHAQAILAGMGYEADRIHMLETGIKPQQPRFAPVRPASFTPLNEKRKTLDLALHHLVAEAPSATEGITLSAGAFLGTVEVNDKRCTLCMACATLCPARALRAGHQQVPRLSFVEAPCLQCGLCANACPEHAIRLVPRLLYDRATREQLRVLYEETPFRCLRCQKAYTTLSTVERLTAQLRDHPMFQGEAMDRLRMCEDCRAASIVADAFIVKPDKN
jgi:ferredoxin